MATKTVGALGSLSIPATDAAGAPLPPHILRILARAAAPAGLVPDEAESLAKWDDTPTGDVMSPAEAGVCYDPPDLTADPPQGPDAWLGQLPAPILSEYCDALDQSHGTEIWPAGLCDRDQVAGRGFASGGIAEKVPPGPALARFVGNARAEGVHRLSDDELIGFLLAARRLQSWAAALELGAVSHLVDRRRGDSGASSDNRTGEHVHEEIAAALTLTGRSADVLVDLALSLRRLPATHAALEEGRIDRAKAVVIAEETAGLAPGHCSAVEEQVLPEAPGQTTGRLRAATRRAVLAADSDAARTQKEQAQREARVEKWDERRGTAALAGRDLPSAQALAADQNITMIARALKQAGLNGGLDEIRARVFLALLMGEPVSGLLRSASVRSRKTRPADTAASGPGSGPPGGVASGATPAPASTSAADPAPSPGPAPNPGPAAWRAARAGGTAGSAAGEHSDPIAGPAETELGSILGRFRGTVNLTMPLATWLGLSDAPGDVPGFGPLDADESRALARMLGSDTHTRWCVTLTGQNGRAVAHACARNGPPPSGSPPGTGPSGADPAHPPGPWPPPLGTQPRSGPSDAGPSDPPGPWPPSPRLPSPGPPSPGPPSACPHDQVGAWLSSLRMEQFETGTCSHARETSAYRPSPSLDHLVKIRQRTCCFPGCRRPALRCDLDHSLPFEEGGRTCECNLAPLCRRHHRAKQARRWRLEQAEPGVMMWTLPHGRTYRVAAESCS